MLQPGMIRNELKQFMQDAQKNVAESEEDRDAAMDAFCAKIEDLVYRAIKSQRITILPGIIQVVGSQSAQANAAPLIIEGEQSFS